MFLPPLSVFTQCIQCAPGIPHANFVEQFVIFAERHLDKSRLEEAETRSIRERLFQKQHQQKQNKKKSRDSWER